MVQYLLTSNHFLFQLMAHDLIDAINEMSEKKKFSRVWQSFLLLLTNSEISQGLNHT